MTFSHPCKPCTFSAGWLIYGIEHFENLNEILEKVGENEEYIFHFLSPNAYPEFFEYLKNGKILDGQSKFRCELENLLQ